MAAASAVGLVGEVETMEAEAVLAARAEVAAVVLVEYENPEE